MARRPTVYFSAGFAARGLALAEQRLAYLTELYDSGRWRRFHDDADFLAMVRDTRTAVETWQRILNSEQVGCDEVAAPSVQPAAASQESFASDLVAECLAAPAAAVGDDVATGGGRLLLPPITFSTHGVLTEDDLAEA